MIRHGLNACPVLPLVRRVVLATPLRLLRRSDREDSETNDVALDSAPAEPEPPQYLLGRSGGRASLAPERPMKGGAPRDTSPKDAEQNPLHTILRLHLASFLAEARRTCEPPREISSAFRACIERGWLQPSATAPDAFLPQLDGAP